MDKISSILPSNPRVQSVDMDEAPPARPGAPAFGRKAGRNTVSDRVSLSQKAKDLAAQDTMMVKNPKEASRAKKVEELNRRFFETRLQKPEIEEPVSQAVTESLEDSDRVEVGRLRDGISQYETPDREELKATNLSIEA
jgi:hypothetical protein